MSKKESVKAHISMLQIVFVALLTAYLGLLGYVLIHIDDNFSIMQIIYGFIALCFLSVALIVIFRKYFNLVKKLEKMK